MRCLARGLIYCKDKGQRKNYQLTRIEPPHIYFLSFHKCELRAPSAERDDKGLYEPAGECQHHCQLEAKILHFPYQYEVLASLQSSNYILQIISLRTHVPYSAITLLNINDKLIVHILLFKRAEEKLRIQNQFSRLLLQLQLIPFYLPESLFSFH